MQTRNKFLLEEKDVYVSNTLSAVKYFTNYRKRETFEELLEENSFLCGMLQANYFIQGGGEYIFWKL
jgi:hypothetical protein